jgi:hypothetical protein
MLSLAKCPAEIGESRTRSIAATETDSHPCAFVTWLEVDPTRSAPVRQARSATQRCTRNRRVASPKGSRARQPATSRMSPPNALSDGRSHALSHLSLNTSPKRIPNLGVDVDLY